MRVETAAPLSLNVCSATTGPRLPSHPFRARVCGSENKQRNPPSVGSRNLIPHSRLLKRPSVFLEHVLHLVG